MNKYVFGKLEGLAVKKGDNEDRELNEKERNAFRSVLQKAAWPARRVAMAAQYKVSNLAAKSSCATVQDQKLLNQVVSELRELANSGELRLTFSPTDESTSVMVTAHDAGYACEQGGKSQACRLRTGSERSTHPEGASTILCA
eukprot:5016376-Amphidinium_carterae.3